MIIGGFVATSSYTQNIKFETPFETSAIPVCGIEEVAFSGVAKFTFHEKTNPDGTSRQSVHMVYLHTRGEGMTSGTQYNTHENDRSTLIDEGNSNIIRTVMHGSFIGKGQAVNTLVTTRLVTILHDNGDSETIVDNIDIKCNDEHFSN